MPFEIIRNDITAMKVDAIVNSVSTAPLIGSGVDAGIHHKAGPELLAAREKIAVIPLGHAAITPGYRLPAKYVIHTAAPVWQEGSSMEQSILRNCYLRSLMLAYREGCRSVAFPLIAAGNQGFPKSLALDIALESIRNFLDYHEMHVILVVFDRDSFRLSEGLHREVAAYIDEKYVHNTRLREYGIQGGSSDIDRQQALRNQFLRRQNTLKNAPCSDTSPFQEPHPRRIPGKAESPSFARSPKPKLNLSQRLEKLDAGFSETLLKLIDQTGKKDSEIYGKANVSRQHFSKIRNNPDYKPTKSTALAFAMALELNLAQTRDLIGRAGFALTESSKFDLIIMFFIQERNYDLYEINATLFEFDQPLLGTQNVT